MNSSIACPVSISGNWLNATIALCPMCILQIHMLRDDASQRAFGVPEDPHRRSVLSDAFQKTCGRSSTDPLFWSMKTI